jgi:hypothetical protein
VARKARKRPPSAIKVVDETILLKRPRRGAKYSLAYVNPRICWADNGRILGYYDNSHDYHHRHFMGKVERVEFDGYEALAARFYGEVQELWRKEDEER